MNQNKRFVNVAEYQRISGLSYQTVMHMIRTNQINYITTESGKFKIDMLNDVNKLNADMVDKLNETRRLVGLLCKQFNTIT